MEQNYPKTGGIIDMAEEKKGGKFKYETPVVFKLDELDKGSGANGCTNGSADSFCTNGSAAKGACDTGALGPS
jgi:hypothetical protein